MTSWTRLTIAGSLVLATLSAGCSVKARPVAMVPVDFAVERQHVGSVLLDTTGTEGDGIVTMTLINGDDFTAALERTIVQSRLFSEVVRSSTPDYRLYVEAKATAPAGGFNMTVRVGGTWRLTDVRTNRVVFDEFLNVSARKTVGDAFVGTTRVRLAIEAAAQEFIREGIQRLAQIELPDTRTIPAADGKAGGGT